MKTSLILHTGGFITALCKFVTLQPFTKPEQPKAPLANNVRPVQDLNGRSVRTNIKFERRKVEAGGDMCPEVVKDLTFKANSIWTSSVPKMENPYMRGFGGTY